MKKAFILAALMTAIPVGQNSEAAEAIAGSPTAPVQLTIYGDLKCPYTKKLMSYVDRLETEYGTKIGIQFSEFPLAFHVEAKPAAIAALCADRQGELRAFLKGAFAQSDKLGHDFYLQLAKDIGIRDQRGFEECMGSLAMAVAVDNEISDGKKAGVSSTPTTFINGEVVLGAYPYEEYKKRIDKLLN